MKLKKEDLFSSLIGLAPVVAIAMIFKNNDVACMYWLKQYNLITSTILTLADTDWVERDMWVIATTQRLNFSGAVGQMIASVLFAVAAMEHENLRENTKRGIAAARSRGVKLGKLPKLFAKDIVPLLQEGLSIARVSKKLGKTRQAIYDALKRENVDLDKSREQMSV